METCTIRADPPTQSLTASNIADGTWFLDLRLDSRSFVGRWNVIVTVDQTSGITTCTDVVTIGVVSAPNTDARASSTRQREGANPLALAAIAGGAFAVAALILRRLLATPR